MGLILLLTIPCHGGLAALLFWRLQSLATRIAETDRTRRPALMKPGS